MRKKYRMFFLGMAAAGMLAGCQGQERGTSGGESGAAVEEEKSQESDSETQEGVGEALLQDDMFTDQDKEIGYDETSCVNVTLADDGSSCDGSGVSIEGNQITIQDEGTYRIQGTLSDGQIVIDAQKTDTIHLILDGMSVSCSDSAAFYVKQADHVFCTLAADSVNAFSSPQGFRREEEDNVDAAIFSKDDLTWNGEGTLEISSQGNGITSKNDLVFVGGVYEITAEGHGMEGKDSVRAAFGSFSITSGKDGIHAENKDDASKGFVYIADGAYAITAQGDGVDAATVVQIDGGEMTITAGGGSKEADESSDEKAPGFANRGEETSEEETETVSTKGVKAGQMIRLLDGTYQVDSMDDAIHSNGDIEVEDGTFLLSSGDDAVHADGAVVIQGGSMEIPVSYEGIEGMSIWIQGGDISLTSSDDGMNAAGGEEDQGGSGGFMEEANEENWIRIDGGRVAIRADGDGIDSNGDLYISGGEVFVSGPVSGGDGSLDYAGTAEITGGVVVATAKNGMEQNFSDTSSQGAILVTTASTLEAGDAVSLQDSDGNVLVEYAPEESYNSVLVSSPDITVGSVYTVTAGEEEMTVEMTELIYGSVSIEAGGRGFGGRGMPPGERHSPDGEDLPEGKELPEGETPPEEKELPEGETPPEEMELPEGETPPEEMELPEGKEPPEGETPPEGKELPEGMEPPEGETPPEGELPPGDAEPLAGET